MTRLVEEVLALVKVRPLSAVVRSDHELAREILVKAKFKLAGVQAETSQEAQISGQLFLRDDA